MSYNCEICGMWITKGEDHECDPKVPVNIVFESGSIQDLRCILEAESRLKKKGITFDTGSGMGALRDWCFEWQPVSTRKIIIREARRIMWYRGRSM